MDVLVCNSCGRKMFTRRTICPYCGSQDLHIEKYSHPQERQQLKEKSPADLYFNFSVVIIAIVMLATIFMSAAFYKTFGIEASIISLIAGLIFNSILYILFGQINQIFRRICNEV